MYRVYVYVQGLILKNKLGVGNIAEKAETLFLHAKFMFSLVGVKFFL